jgi:hypothetical protein
VTSRRASRIAAAACVAAAVAGCGFGTGPSSKGEATLTVTRDYGAEVIVDATVEDPNESETVLRFLDREADITTRYGGGFVQSIEGLAGEARDGRTLDWFFYVDGIESPVGSAERGVGPGQRIWWDYRDWTDAMRVPAVVGSWPQPLAPDATLDCRASQSMCDELDARLAEAGVETDEMGDEAPRVLAGPWQALRDDPAAALLERDPSESGVFARFERAGGSWELTALDDHAAPAATYRDRAGLVAAVRDGDDPPTWLVTGTDRDGVDTAAELLDGDSLATRYAVLTADGDVTALPVRGPQ